MMYRPSKNAVVPAISRFARAVLVVSIRSKRPVRVNAVHGFVFMLNPFLGLRGRADVVHNRPVSGGRNEMAASHDDLADCPLAPVSRSILSLLNAALSKNVVPLIECQGD